MVCRFSVLSLRAMISALTGQVRHVGEGRVSLGIGPAVCELLVSAADAPELAGKIGEEVTFHTLMYLEGDPNRGNLEPRMLGFLRAEDKGFFELFTTVKGIGPKTALRALTVPVGEIAAAIESKDTGFLCKLDGVGKRTAELIVAELGGKAVKFMTAARLAAGAPPRPQRRREDEEVIELLVGGGERRSDAELLLHRVRQVRPDLKETDDLWREALRLRSS
jgi:Holliday junction DNA helicase RuvA